MQVQALSTAQGPCGIGIILSASSGESLPAPRWMGGAVSPAWSSSFTHPARCGPCPCRGGQGAGLSSAPGHEGMKLGRAVGTQGTLPEHFPCSRLTVRFGLLWFTFLLKEYPFLKRLYFSEQFYVHSKIERKAVIFLTHPLPLYTPDFLHHHNSHQSGASLLTNEPARTHHFPWSPLFTPGFTLLVVYSVGLDKCIMTCVHQYSMIQSIFIALKILPEKIPGT